jgi:hypothetical protein
VHLHSAHPLQLPFPEAVQLCCESSRGGSSEATVKPALLAVEQAQCAGTVATAMHTCRRGHTSAVSHVCQDGSTCFLHLEQVVTTGARCLSGGHV